MAKDGQDSVLQSIPDSVPSSAEPLLVPSSSESAAPQRSSESAPSHRSTESEATSNSWADTLINAIELLLPQSTNRLIIPCVLVKNKVHHRQHRDHRNLESKLAIRIFRLATSEYAIILVLHYQIVTLCACTFESSRSCAP